MRDEARIMAIAAEVVAIKAPTVTKVKSHVGAPAVCNANENGLEDTA
jgi:hypothetical protein